MWVGNFKIELICLDRFFIKKERNDVPNYFSIGNDEQNYMEETPLSKGYMVSSSLKKQNCYRETTS